MTGIGINNLKMKGLFDAFTQLNKNIENYPKIQNELKEISRRLIEIGREVDELKSRNGVTVATSQKLVDEIAECMRTIERLKKKIEELKPYQTWRSETEIIGMRADKEILSIREHLDLRLQEIQEEYDAESMELSNKHKREQNDLSKKASALLDDLKKTEKKEMENTNTWYETEKEKLNNKHKHELSAIDKIRRDCNTKLQGYISKESVAKNSINTDYELKLKKLDAKHNSELAQAQQKEVDLIAKIKEYDAQKEAEEEAIFMNYELEQNKLNDKYRQSVAVLNSEKDRLKAEQENSEEKIKKALQDYGETRRIETDRLDSHYAKLKSDAQGKSSNWKVASLSSGVAVGFFALLGFVAPVLFAIAVLALGAVVFTCIKWKSSEGDMLSLTKEHSDKIEGLKQKAIDDYDAFKKSQLENIEKIKCRIADVESSLTEASLKESAIRTPEKEQMEHQNWQLIKKIGDMYHNLRKRDEVSYEQYRNRLESSQNSERNALEKEYSDRLTENEEFHSTLRREVAYTLEEATTSLNSSQRKDRKEIEANYSRRTKSIKDKYSNEREVGATESKISFERLHRVQQVESQNLNRTFSDAIRLEEENSMALQRNVKEEASGKINNIRQAAESYNAEINRKREDSTKALKETERILNKHHNDHSGTKNAQKRQLELVYRLEQEAMRLKARKNELEGILARNDSFFQACIVRQENSLIEIRQNEGVADFQIPNPIHFLGQEITGYEPMRYASALRHDLKPVILLYRQDKGLAMDNIDKFMERLIEGITLSTDIGIAKNQYVVDVTEASRRFSPNFKKENELEVILNRSLSETFGKIEKDCDARWERMESKGYNTFEELNRSQKASNPDMEHIDRPAYSILHIVIPKRNQIDSTSNLMNSGFARILRNYKYMHGLKILLYIHIEEWVSGGKLAEKVDDIVYEAKRSAPDANVYEIDNIKSIAKLVKSFSEV